MFIAFEGPDNTGKSTSADHLSFASQGSYNVTKEMHQRFQEDFSRAGLVNERELVVTYDRIDWFTHMVYRLAIPEGDWDDDRPRTVFAMPDTHLVVKLHHPKFEDFTADEAVHTPIARVNPMYWEFATYFMELNYRKDYTLFRSVSIMEVVQDTENRRFEQHLRLFDSPSIEWVDGISEGVDSDNKLLGLLRSVEQHTL